ncbi:MAG: hypothetical protein ACRD9R_09020 [Pyrinomonadaceae bacterium]
MDERILPWVKTPAEVEEEISQHIESLTDTITSGQDDPGEQRAAAQRVFRQVLRAAFMSHYAATEEDFDRCWPKLRDDLLCEHAKDVFYAAFDTEDDDEWEDFEDEKENGRGY